MPSFQNFQKPFAEALDYFRQKINLPAQEFTDILGAAHDRAFIVSGAMKDDLVADLRKAVDDAIVQGLTLKQFQDRFEEIVAEHGWTGWTGEGSKAGRAWRARVIYETNIRTSYAAGRYKQMIDPDMVKVRPYWRYRHAFHRWPRVPRQDHKSWDGLILKWDDPWWNTHFPPNGFGCSCGVEPISRRELKKLGRTEPDNAPPDMPSFQRDPRTGTFLNIPQGIGIGWNYAPGQSWIEAVIPRELQEPLKPLDDGERRSLRISDLLSLPVMQAFRSRILRRGLSEEAYVSAFLSRFNLNPGESGIYRDRAGHIIPVSEDLFKSLDGAWKIKKRGREVYAERLAETLQDPDEIWLEWFQGKDGRPVLYRTYIRRDPETNGYILMQWGKNGWQEVAAFNADNEKYLQNQRRGALLYRRKDEP